MRLFFATHAACFRAEWIKLKRTGLFWMGLGAALLIPLIMTIVGFVIHDSSTDKEAWTKLFETNIRAFGGFFYPLFLIITMVRLVYLEHKADTWKVLETQPVSRAALFLVKYEVALLVAALSLLLLVAFTALGGLLLQAAGTQSALAASKIEWSRVGGLLLRYWVASTGILALHYYFALLIRTFGWPLVIGLIGILAGGTLAGFGIWNWFPWSAMALTSAGSDGGSKALLLPHEWLALAWALLALLLSYQLLTRRSFVNAHLRGRSALFTGAGVLAFAVLAWKLTEPVLLGRYHGTVLAGRVRTDGPVSQVLLLRAPAQDTLLAGPVAQGSFHLRGHNAIQPGIYTLQIGSQQLPVYFGSNDSLFVDLTATKEKFTLRFGGTRVAENEFLAQERLPDFSSIARSGLQSPPKEFSSRVLNNLDGYTQKLARFHTADNVRAADDFADLYRKLCAIELLRIVNIEYPKSFLLYHPNDTLRFSNRLEKMRDEIGLNDAYLVHQPGYLQYVADLLRAKASRSANRDSALLALAQRTVANPEVREAFYLTLFAERLQRLSDSGQRNAFVATVLPEFSNASYRNLLQLQLRRLNSMMRGRPAPDFAAETGNGAGFRIDRFRGRYVLFDVWATWCGPCRREAPYFEELAERYTDDRLLFVSLSVDEDREAWRRETVMNDARVLPLHVPDAASAFLEPYGISTIPRYILIDPQGRILNANMPPPSDPEFASILQREIPFVSRY